MLKWQLLFLWLLYYKCLYLLHGGLQNVIGTKNKEGLCCKKRLKSRRRLTGTQDISAPWTYSGITSCSGDILARIRCVLRYCIQQKNMPVGANITCLKVNVLHTSFVLTCVLYNIIVWDLCVFV